MDVAELGIGMPGSTEKLAGRVGMLLVSNMSWRAARGAAAAMAEDMSSTARRVTVWNWRVGGMDSTRVGQTSVARLRVRTTSRRKVAFLFWDSARVT